MSTNNAAVDLDEGEPVKQNNGRPVGTCFLSAIFF